MKTNINFTFDKVRFDQENELHLVLSLKAPKKDWEKERSPICVFPVIDISGSMNGSKLDYAKKSAIKLVDHLTENDYAGIATFGSKVQVLSKPVRVTKENKDKLKNIIGDLHDKDMTAFGAGLLAGLEEVNSADLPNDMIYRVIMLTDGHANVGISDQDGLVNLLKENLGKATVSCFGYGSGANQELLSDLASIGKGNYAYIQNPDDALTAFAKELGGLLSTYAQNIELEVKSENGHEVIEVISDVETDGDNKKVTIKVPEILSEEENNIVLAVKLSKQTKALPRALNAFNVKVSYDVLGKDGKSSNKVENLKAKIKFVKEGKEQAKPTESVDKIVGLAQALKAQIEAEEHATRGDFGAARGVMEALSVELNSRGLKKQAAYVVKTGEMVASAANFSASSSYRTGARNLIRRRVGTTAGSEATNDIYKLVDDDVNNDAQKYMQNDFTSTGSVQSISVNVNTGLLPSIPKAEPVEKVSTSKSISKSRSGRW